MIQDILFSIWQGLNEVSPPIIWAVLIFLSGWFISKWLGNLTRVFLDKIHLNYLFKRIGWEEMFSRLALPFSVTGFLSQIVRWFLVLLFLMLSAEILDFYQFSQFLEKVVIYYKNIFIGALIFLIAAFLVDFSQKIVVGTLEKEKIIYTKFLGNSIRWIIWFFAGLAILYQLQIVSPLILVIFVGMVITISLSLGLAFGLGGKDLAQRILKDLEDKFK